MDRNMLYFRNGDHNKGYLVRSTSENKLRICESQSKFESWVRVKLLQSSKAKTRQKTQRIQGLKQSKIMRRGPKFKKFGEKQLQLQQEVSPEPLHILDKRKVHIKKHTIVQLKLQWKHFEANEAIWENEATIRKDYPTLFHV